jgi:alkanesulfonate monooxygenase SsuD/methylene tetrahydromethanopterin reductase-like flavin-dependent oxidoreductase (luciferase family)
VFSATWHDIYKDTPERQATCDPWIALTAMALHTERVRIGTMVTPIARRRPWKLARETVTLDHLSKGRLILPVALGSAEDGAFSKVGEETDRKVRAQKLDEGLAILAGLWSGRPFSFSGQHYQMDEMTFLPTPVQSPRIPVWVVGAWPKRKSMRRALRWDGLLPAIEAESAAADVREIKAYVDEQRVAQTPFDIVIEARSSGSDRQKAISTVQAFVEAGATWWLESVWMRLGPLPHSVDGIRRRIEQGPPRAD